MAFTVDANVAILWQAQEVLNTSTLVDMSGNESAGLVAVGNPLALQTGPSTGIYSRYADGINGKYFTVIASSTTWQNAVQNQMTLEMVFTSNLFSNAASFRTLYALSNGAAKFLWVFYDKPDNTWLVDWTHGGVEQNFEFGSGLADDAWYYMALRKTVTSGTTINNRISTWDVWLKPLTGNWSDTPDFSFPGQVNSDDVGGPNNSVGAYWQGSPAFFGSYHIAGIRGSTIPRTVSEMSANFYSYKGLVGGPPLTGLSATGSAKTVTITLSENGILTGDSANPTKWLISPTLSVTNVTISGSIITLTTDNQIGGQSYTVSIPAGIGKATDGSVYFGPSTLNFSGAITPVTILIIRTVDARTIDITYSAPVNKYDALNTNNYSINNGLLVTGITQLSSTIFRLSTTHQTVGVSYTVTASNIGAA